MFKSTEAILNQYVDGVSRYGIYSVEMERGENPEDLYYLCHVGDAWYVVYETDYMSSLDRVAKEATGLFEGSAVRPLGWLVKKDQQSALHTKTVPLDVSVDTKSLILQVEGSHLRYAVLAVETDEREERYDPNAYGSTLSA